MQDVFIGRQPIFDCRIQVYAYELLYRDGYVGYARINDVDQASCDVLANVLLEIGLENIVGPHKAFCNFSQGFLLQKPDLSFAAQQLVVEILETVQPTAEVLTAIDRFRAAGHLIALDDFVYDAGLQPLVDRADIIKLEVLNVDFDLLRQRIDQLRGLKPKLIFLAEKVETNEVFQACRDLGFDYFQGYFFSKPKIVTGKKLPPSRLALLQLVAELQRPDVVLERVEQIIQSDVNLSVKLLRQINSSYYSLIHPVSSIRQAIVRFGLDHIRTWTCVLLLGSVSEKPLELMGMALIRGRMCALLAQQSQPQGVQTCFTVGLFSLLDSILDAPMEQILASLPLSQEIKTALLEHGGPCGAILDQVKTYEASALMQQNGAVGGNPALRTAYWEAVKWADHIRAGLC